MKKITTFLFAVGLFSTSFAQNLPNAPRRVTFSDVDIVLNSDAQKLVQDEISSLLLPENRYLFDKLDRLQSYFPVIEKILEDEVVPEDFKYLAVVESSLIADAVSSSNAVGYWQLKAETATDLGLQIDEKIDERKNIYASTKGAAMYLKRNNIIYKNWISTLYSYALGATGISKLVPTSWVGASEISLDGNTNRYIIKAIASKIAFEYRLNSLREPANIFFTYNNGAGKSLEQIASELAVNAVDLKKHNAWLLSETIPTDKNYLVIIPTPNSASKQVADRIKGKNVKSKTTNQTKNPINSEDNSTQIPTSYANGYPILEKIMQANSSSFEPVLYKINGKKGILAQKGDNIALLAARAKISTSKFLKVNDMAEKDIIATGNVYYLEQKDKKAKAAFHALSKNQSLWDISQMYGVKLSKIIDYNRLENFKLEPNRVLWLQEKMPKNKAIEYVPETKTPVEKTETPIAQQAKKDVDEVIVIDKTTSTTIVINPNDVAVPTFKTITEATEEPAKKTNVVILEEEPKTTTTIIEPTKEVITKTENSEIIVIDEDSKTMPLTINPATETVEETPSNEEKIVTKTIKTHLIKQGESFYSIARKYNMMAKELATLNNISTNEKVKFGQRLKVYAIQENSALPEKPVIENTPKTDLGYKTSTTVHVVKSGESLLGIAQKYKTSAKQLAILNNFSATEKVKIGQHLKIFAGNNANSLDENSAKNIIKHTVKRGETLSDIAEKYEVSAKKIREWNNMKNSTVKLGEKLLIKN